MTMLAKSPQSAAFFAGRVAVIATMHHKERAIAPSLESALGVKTRVPPEFNTDSFGTFTRDVKRPTDQLNTARLKAAAALAATGETLAIASEGSFGPHPQIPFVPCDRELVLLLDRQHQFEIVGEALSTDTNHRAKTVHTVQEALDFAQTVGFPTHGVVVMRAANDCPPETIFKGITTEARLTEAVTLTLAQSPVKTAHIETDMRALYNPTRMKVIAKATQDLIRAIEHQCPNCDCPGFSIIRHNPGLPCELCGLPTLLTLSVSYHCQRCQFQQTKRFPDSRPVADPADCPYCNP
ncbi:MAG: DUF6671 family protein [Cyanobacteria bacterium P01_D01_bin.6]